MKRALCLPLLLLGACVGQLDGVEDDGTSDPLIRGTRLARQAPGDHAVVVVRADPPGQFLNDATGFLVAPDLVLTAAHNVHEHFVGKDARLQIYTGARLGRFGQWVSVVTPTMHDRFDPLDPYAGFDLAFLRLERAIDDVTPLPIRREPLDAGDVGQQVRVIGYGAHNPESVDTRRQANFNVEALADRRIKLVSPAGENACVGDSGGPALLAEGGVERVIGVTNATIARNGRCTTLGHYQTRVDVNLAFIDRFLPAVVAPSPGSP